MDMEGNRYSYLVAAIEHSDSVPLDKLISEDYDLTVFIKNSMAMDYTIVRFNLK